MSVPVFVDTNVLVYADDRADPEKREKAREIIRGVVRDQSVRLSLQVLQEYFVVATRKLGLDANAAKSRLQIYSQLQIVKIDHTDLLAAIDLHRLHGFALWDALIVRAAIVSGCRTLYTEDLQHGFRIENLEVVNPFLSF